MKPRRALLSQVSDDFSQQVRPGEVVGSPSDCGAVRLGVDVEARLSVDAGGLRLSALGVPGWGRQAIAYGPLENRGGLALGVLLLSGHANAQAEGLKESLAVGFFDQPVPDLPLEAGPALVLQGHPRANGRLCAAKRQGVSPLLQGVPALPIYFLVLLRERGVLFYAGALEATGSLPALPSLRPLGLEPYGPVARWLYAGVHQAVGGERSHRADTRVYGVRVVHLPQWQGWGPALAADPQPQLGRRAALGGVWRLGKPGMLLEPAEPGGLLHLRLTPPAALLWRYHDPENYLALELGGGLARLCLWYRGRSLELAVEPYPGDPGAPRWVQVLDDGKALGITLDGRALFFLEEPRLADGRGVGLVGLGADLEVHPRRVDLPSSLAIGHPRLPKGQRTVLVPYLGDPSEELLLFWEPTLGPGNLAPAEGGIRVEGAQGARSLYTVPWADLGMADLEVEVLPAQGGEARCRAGVCFWQDEKHHLVVALDLEGEEFRVVAYLRFAGYEDPRRAVWAWIPRPRGSGVGLRLRAVCDGHRFLAYLDGEPVLYRALADIYPGALALELRRVGLGLSGHGEDDGSVFRAWVARR